MQRTAVVGLVYVSMRCVCACVCVCMTVNVVHLCAWRAPCVYFPEGCLGVACTLFVDLRTFFHPADTCVTVGTTVCSRGSVGVVCVCSHESILWAPAHVCMEVLIFCTLCVRCLLTCGHSASGGWVRAGFPCVHRSAMSGDGGMITYEHRRECACESEPWLLGLPSCRWQ